jgi:hypothetical protein
MDEQNTTRKIIEPLTETLGWDILSADVGLEYSVQMGSGTKNNDGQNPYRIGTDA